MMSRLVCCVLIGVWACSISVQDDLVHAREIEHAVDLIESGEFCLTDAATRELFSLGEDVYPILRDLLLVKEACGQPCGHELTHIGSSPIILEKDPGNVQNGDSENDIPPEPFTVGHFAAYLIIAAHIEDLYFAESCVMITESNSQEIIMDLYELLGDFSGNNIGCGLRDILSRHGVKFSGCPLGDDPVIDVADLGIRCDEDP
jgi:hypothetical protein